VSRVERARNLFPLAPGRQVLTIAEYVRREAGAEAPDRIIGRDRSYSGTWFTYNRAMSTTEHVMTVSQNGQVSIPAATRARWNARRVIVVDLGDRVVMRPLPDQPVAELEGKYKGRGPTSDRARRQARRAEASRER
jgi:bifunctional DNA-binding transcriptional regulator/antitoxin component of YhaV-PrlF toxin-antitoxin module